LRIADCGLRTEFSIESAFRNPKSAMTRVVYSPRYAIDLGLHVFPTEKYGLVLDELLHRGVTHASEIVEPAPATWDELALVHTPEYLQRMRSGAMTPEEVEQLELPWSQEMVDGFRLMTGGTIDAACFACDVFRHDGTQSTLSSQKNRFSAGSTSSAVHVVCHLGGGLHHAFPTHGEGFCPFNDVAVATRVVQSRGIERIAIVDLDVHHGNGTAFIFESDPRVFTFSMHQQHNYPMWKPRSSLDVGLAEVRTTRRIFTSSSRHYQR